MSLHLFELILGIALLIALGVVAWCIYSTASLDDFASEADWTLWQETTRR